MLAYVETDQSFMWALTFFRFGGCYFSGIRKRKCDPQASHKKNYLDTFGNLRMLNNVYIKKAARKALLGKA